MLQTFVIGFASGVVVTIVGAYFVVRNNKKMFQSSIDAMKADVEKKTGMKI